MYIHEYQAKDILQQYNIRIPKGVLIANLENIEKTISNLNWEKFVVKGQVYSGGRGKAGGIKLFQDKLLAIEFIKKLFGSKLVTNQTNSSGQTVSCIYIEEAIDIKSEFYLAIKLDVSKKMIRILTSLNGGVDIENNSAINIIDLPWTLQNYHTFMVLESLKLNLSFFEQMQTILNGTINIMKNYDATQIEINPLVLTNQDEILALDAKINFDDNANFRQKTITALRDETQYDALEIQAIKYGLSYVHMEGNIGCIVNGAGLAMATADLIALNDQKPANFLDVGGGVTKETCKAAIKIVVSDARVQKILINIFGGIVQCDLIAESIIEVVKDINIQIPIIVRLCGTNSDIALEKLNFANLKNITFAHDLEDIMRLL